ncbi:MAG: sigma-70 family RNA polymerase sigma factor [Thermomicrobiales bacterium]
MGNHGAIPKEEVDERAVDRHADMDDDVSALTDDELVRRAQANPETFGLLYERYARDIHAFIMTKVQGNTEVAQDLTSQVFTRALTALPRFQTGAFRGWLYQIARNLVIDSYRRQRPTAPLTDAEFIAADQRSLDEHVIAADARAQLHAALGQLRPNQREIVLLRLHGLTGAEIAERLNMHPDAVKSAQYRAFAKLRTHLQHLSTDQREKA